MKTCGSLILLCSLSVCVWGQQKLSYQLQQALSEPHKRSTEVTVLVQGYPALLTPDPALSRKERARYVVPRLQEHAAREQARMALFAQEQGIAWQVEQPYWIANMVRLTVPLDALPVLERCEAVRYIEIHDEQTIMAHEPMRSKASRPRSVNGIEPGIEAVKARFLWNLGYTGRNTQILNYDTGVWPDHPSFGDRFMGFHRPLEQAWFPYDRQRPGDKRNSHGTHTNGTCIGLDPATNDTIGIAFNAYFLATDPIVSNPADIRPLHVIALGYQWAMDPDGDPNTVDDIPDVINNSWGRASDSTWISLLCDGFFEQVLISVEAAGILSFQSAGNSGPGAGTAGVPASGNPSLVNNFAVGAVNADDPSWPIAGFSSRGPSPCPDTGALAIKPEVVAPGVNVRSAVRMANGQYDYDNYQGTSMAAPHVAGVALLLVEAFPMASAVEIKEALYYSAIDLGDPGEDNVYGRGMIDAEAAYNYLAQSHTPSTPLTGAFDLSIDRINLESIEYTCDNAFSAVIHLDATQPVPATAVEFVFGFEGETEQVHTISSGTLTAGDSITLPSVSTVHGNKEFYAEIRYTGAMAEDDLWNNRRYARFLVLEQTTVPYLETFEDNLIAESGWYVDDPDNVLTWDTIPTGGLFNNVKSAGIELFNYNPRAGQFDGLVSPIIQVPDAGGLWLTYHYSYQLKTAAFPDTLSVWVSSNCGDSWNLLGKRGGQDLNTTTEPLVNEWVPQTPADWARDSIDLSAWVGQGNLIFRFQSQNGGGSHLYLDNVQVSDHPWPVTVAESEVTSVFRVYPNPAKESFSVEVSDPEIGGTVSLWDLRGTLVRQWAYQPDASYALDGLPTGMYLLEVPTKNGSQQQPLVIE